jgi:putative peptide zinc metalloprotease protein
LNGGVERRGKRVVNMRIFLFQNESKVMAFVTCRIADDYDEVLYKSGLLEGTEPDKIEKRELDLVSLKLLDLDIKDCSDLFIALGKRVAPIFFGLSLPILIWGTLHAGQIYRIYSDLASNLFFNLSVINLVTIIATFVFSLTLHEVSHAVVASRYGLTPKEIIVSLYMYISPMVYLKIPGIYTVKPARRNLIWIAGVYMNFTLSCMAFLLIWFFPGYQYQLSLIVFANVMLALMNLTPLLPLDGYFILSTVMKEPNLRKNSFLSFAKLLQGKARAFRLKPWFPVLF